MDILLGFCLGLIVTSIACLREEEEQSFTMLQQERDSLESELHVKKLHQERLRCLYYR